MEYKLTIRDCTISELEGSPNISELLEEYAQESSIKGLPHPMAKAETYKQLENNGTIYTIAAFIDDLLIGYVVTVCSIFPHYSARIASTESFFVLKTYRKTGAGLKLLRAAENRAKELGAVGMLVSAPLGGKLAEVLPNIGYSETNRVFFRKLENELSAVTQNVPSMSVSAISKVRELEEFASHLPQVDVNTSHVIHAGMYARTVTIPAGTMITGVLIKIPTILILQGDVIVYLGEKSVELSGYNVLSAGANRKQAFYAKTETNLTMMFPTRAVNVEDVEEEFTDEAHMLISRRDVEFSPKAMGG